MHWLSAVSRIVLLLFAAAVLGWFFGDALVGLSAAAIAVLLYWSFEMYRLQRWLADTDSAPPDSYGIWGEIAARIYKSQREADANRERLQSTVDYLLASFAAMRDGVVIIEGEQGFIRWCNDAAKRLLGLRYPDDIGQAVSNLVRVPEFIEYLAEADYAEPLQFYTGGEPRVHLQLVVTPFAGEDRLLFIRDVTDRVRMEQMRRDFVGNVSHELRTPLTVITGYLETFLADPGQLPRSYINPLEQMAQQADRMENLLKDLLWLSRIESEERQEKRELVDVGALLEELREEFSHAYPDRSLQLDISCRDKILGDYRELYSAVSNLVTNAFKYSPGDSPVSATWCKHGGNHILVVRDQGIGIEASHFNRLTERFYRVDDSRSSATGGTGLGLAIVKHVAAAHGARLEIDSELGKGSTFTLVFQGKS